MEEKNSPTVELKDVSLGNKIISVLIKDGNLIVSNSIDSQNITLEGKAREICLFNGNLFVATNLGLFASSDGITFSPKKLIVSGDWQETGEKESYEFDIKRVFQKHYEGNIGTILRVEAETGCSKGIFSSFDGETIATTILRSY
jgi:hypothetical protein